MNFLLFSPVSPFSHSNRPDKRERPDRRERPNKFYMTDTSPTNDENSTYSPSPLMGEGGGVGEQLASFPPPLHPLPPGKGVIFNVTKQTRETR